jgi:hypothetical protein
MVDFGWLSAESPQSGLSQITTWNSDEEPGFELGVSIDALSGLSALHYNRNLIILHVISRRLGFHVTWASEQYSF